MRKVYIKGAATTKFGELWDSSPRQLAGAAVREALADAGMTKDSIQALFVGNMLSGILGNQEHLGAFFSEELGLAVPSCKVEGACASGGLAVHVAFLAVTSGLYETVLVLGVEKMTDHKPEDVAAALMGAGSDQERSTGITFPGLYGILARSHMEAYGTTETQLAAVSVKNHFHASLNPKAQFQKSLSIRDVLKSACVADPLKLLDCSPISDGAAAVIISRVKGQGSRVRSGVEIIASAVATDTLGLAERSSLVELKATKIAAQKAFRIAGITAADIDTAEVHDCFTIAEILALEDIGFYRKGQAAAAVTKGEVTLRSAKKVVVNTSGGLKACGHPVGATGVKQIVEVYEQLRSQADRRQVKGARFGLTHNVGGSGATAVVHILKKA
ncbi:hypothetical protein A2154_02230 [Candidatus Gottesmanbacteria bacterium RBG_16_43_7]|uniref:Acetyl-CoA acetyltransferase n=1 Tax=Candidatus Gottesmanbacteria bacterium RBG_16_43_7 TaxID=1798373 RepID=A0A1F5ZAW5_9BACT|nr:MAG: hypothetical protein A2154_02230 [Candidatus Gottesmanbacteria bacterium RBG_16_43_7]